MDTSDVDVVVLRNGFESGYDLVDDVIRFDIGHDLPEFEAGDTPYFWFDVIDIFDHVAEKGLEFLWRAEHLVEFVHF
jgi:hypothetical protein